MEQFYTEITPSRKIHKLFTLRGNIEEGSNICCRALLDIVRAKTHKVGYSLQINGSAWDAGKTTSRSLIDELHYYCKTTWMFTVHGAHICCVPSRAAANNYFHLQLICKLFYQWICEMFRDSGKKLIVIYKSSGWYVVWVNQQGTSKNLCVKIDVMIDIARGVITHGFVLDPVWSPDSQVMVKAIFSVWSVGYYLSQSGNMSHYLENAERCVFELLKYSR